MSRRAEGGLVDRSKPLRFTFDGRYYQGFEGDTLASALIANDVKLVARSFKYHRPRGILTAGADEPNALVTIGNGAYRTPNTRATTVPLYDGLTAVSQNRWPSLAFDLLAVNQLASPLFVAGFYYKTFMRPAWFWEKVYEPIIRRAAGIGSLSIQPDPDCYDREHAFCDLLVIGGGAAGLAAALTAARAGLRVILADEDMRLGGSLLGERLEIDGRQSADWALDGTRELAGMPNVSLLTRTSVFGIYDGCEYTAFQQLSNDGAPASEGAPRERLWKIIARRSILATGATEQPLVFGGNDRPGVMMASAVSTYVNRFAALPGRRAVVVTCSDSGWQSALDLQSAGIEVIALVDTRATEHSLASEVSRGGAKIFLGARVRDALGKTLNRVEIELIDGSIRSLDADLLAMAGAWRPNIGLGAALGAKPVWCESLQSFRLAETPPGLVVAGAANGHYSAAAALTDGVAKAVEQANELGRSIIDAPGFQTSEQLASAHQTWSTSSSRTKAFVDFQNDVTDKDVQLAAQEGFVSVEHLKRYTTLGMATDQGMTSQLNGHALLAGATGRTVGEVGTIRARPPVRPVAIGTLAGMRRGMHFRPTRRTASHELAEALGASFVDVGQWKRAQWFARLDEEDWQDTVNREVRQTRSRVGICDVSTLGKIDVYGDHAGILLDRIYINGFSQLAIGKARYGVMLREDGHVLDDGTVTRFAEDNYYITTTTANAARVMQHIDFARQVLWPELDAQAVSVTEQWSTFAIAGPQSRALLQAAFPDVDLSNIAMPFMRAMRFRWNGYEVRIFRISFSGELAFEVSVSAMVGDQLFANLFEVGEQFGVIPYGTEALGVMRIEKGHVAGNELNGQTTAADLGLGKMMSTKKDFIGRVMAQRPGLIDPSRPALVGLKPIDRTDALRSGGHLFAEGAPFSPANDQGYVTSSAYSATLGHSIALGMLAHGRERYGERVVVHNPLRGGDVLAEVCNPVFYDPEGNRLHG